MRAEMRETDAFTWNMESDPSLRSTIVTVAWLDRAPAWDEFVARVDRASRLVPMFRQRVVDSRLPLSRPRWIVDDNFDLAWHVRRVEAPAPHTAATVVAFARNAAMTAFDGARPLWEFTLVEGLERSRAALVMKLHHALTDGVGGVQLAMHLFDLSPVPEPARLDAPADLPDHGSDTLPDAIADRSRLFGRVGRLAGMLGAPVFHVVRHPGNAAAGAVETARSIGRTVAPVTSTLSPIMRDRSTLRHLDVLEVQVADLKRAAAAAGGSLNDGFMAAVAGGLERYHARHGASVDALRVTLPISIRRPDDAPGGNRITLIRFAVPVADPDPAARVRSMGRRCRAARDERSLDFVDPIAAALNLLPRVAIAGMLKHVDFVASDIPGFPGPIFLSGARVERCVAFGPTIGAAVNFSLISYDGTCGVGITTDAAAVADTDVLTDCVREGFEEVLALGGAHEPVGLPLQATAQPVASASH